MEAFTLTGRQRIEVGGADEVLAAHAQFVSDGLPVGVAAARALAAGDVDWRSAREEIVASERSLVLAEHANGPVLAVRFFPPSVPTSIHDHGHAGAARVVEGQDRYERFERMGRSTARCESVHDLAVDDVVWWGTPPDDLHRQTGRGDGAIELVLLGARPEGTVEFDESPTPYTDLRAAVVAGFLDGDAAALSPWYDEDVLLDANVPEWRYQLQGRERFLEVLRDEDFSMPDRRMTWLRVTDTASGLLLETETRFTDDGIVHRCRQVHNLRVRDDRIVEHALYCTGVPGADTIARNFVEAPMVRL